VTYRTFSSYMSSIAPRAVPLHCRAGAGQAMRAHPVPVDPLLPVHANHAE